MCNCTCLCLSYVFEREADKRTKEEIGWVADTTLYQDWLFDVSHSTGQSVVFKVLSISETTAIPELMSLRYQLILISKQKETIWITQT